jgi:uncharacterized protein DUF1360
MDDLIPSPFEFVLASLAVYRLWRLLAEDDILEPVRRRVLRYVGWKVGDDLPADYRGRWAEFLTCPWCAGFWLGLLAWMFWLFAPSLALVVATPFALSAAVGLIRTNLDRPEE